MENEVKESRILVYDSMDGFFDAYIFNGLVDFEEVKKTISKVQEDKKYEWTLDDIREEIYNKFDVKNVILFDNTGFAPCMTIEVNELEKENEE